MKKEVKEFGPPFCLELFQRAGGRAGEVKAAFGYRFVSRMSMSVIVVF